MEKTTKNKKPEKIKEEKKAKSAKEEKTEKNKAVTVVVRISGMVHVEKNVENTLQRLRLRRKYSCALLNDTKESAGMLKKVRYHVAYGPINHETLEKLIKYRAKAGEDKKIKIVEKDMAKELMSGKTLKQLGLKPFFRLHPPRNGIKSKLQYPKGVLGNNKEDINKLIERML